MNRFVVWSSQIINDTARDVVEVTRSSKNVAEDDAALIRSILHRKAWVQDTEEGVR